MSILSISSSVFRYFKIRIDFQSKLFKILKPQLEYLHTVQLIQFDIKKMSRLRLAATLESNCLIVPAAAFLDLQMRRFCSSLSSLSLLKLLCGIKSHHNNFNINFFFSLKGSDLMVLTFSENIFTYLSVSSSCCSYEHTFFIYNAYS